MTAPSIMTVLVCGYAVCLLGVAYVLDRSAARASRRSASWRTGAFTYHEDHDAWLCPQDQWLWPTSFDPEQRVMRYRAKPSVCNACPVRDTCTESDHGREVTRAIDPWPHSESGRFHRGIACVIALIATLMPLFSLFGSTTIGDVFVLAATVVVVGLCSLPLASHFWSTPSGFPDHVPHDTDAPPPPRSRYARERLQP